MMKVKAKRRGFTLMETVVTILLVTLIGLGIVSMLIYSRRYANLDRERNKAIAVAGRRMEQLKRAFIFDLAPTVEDVLIDDNDTPNNDADDIRGKLEIMLKDKDGNAISGPPTGDERVQLEIVVTWHPESRISGKVLKERLITYVTP